LRNQTVRERAKWETRKRETLYGDFITEASHLIADAFDHTLDKPETLVKLYAISAVSGSFPPTPFSLAEECCDRILKLYSEPNRTMGEISTTLRGGEFEELRHFSHACRIELRKYSVY
jgi:hypothetical protein